MKITLKEIKRNQRQCVDWYHRVIGMPISIYITWILLRLNFTANQATTLMIIFGFISCGFFMVGSRWADLIGLIVLQFWGIMDVVDGEIARNRKLCSLTGMYFDKVSHYLVHPFILFSLSVGLFRRFDNTFYIYGGVIASYSYILLEIIYDVKASIYLLQLCKEGKNQTGAKGFGTPRYQPVPFWLKALKFYLLQPGVLVIVSVVLLVDLFVGELVLIKIKFNLMALLIISYAINYTLSFIRSIYNIVLNREIDNEYSLFFTVEKNN